MLGRAFPANGKRMRNEVEFEFFRRTGGTRIILLYGSRYRRMLMCMPDFLYWKNF